MELEIHTDRLILRPWKEEDVEGMFELNNDEDVERNTGDVPFKNLDEVLQLIRTYDQYSKYKMGRFTILVKEKNEYAGWCGLKFVPETGEIDLGYRVLKSLRGRGIATEAAKAALDYGFRQLRLEKIIGRSIQENTASIVILKKLGMKFEKKFNAHGTICEQYQLSRKDWLNRIEKA